MFSVITAKIGNVIYHAISEQNRDEALIIKYYFPDDFPANYAISSLLRNE